MTTETLDQCAERIVRQGVLCCVSQLVSTLACGVGVCNWKRHGEHGQAVGDLAFKALELAAPIPDYEEAAIQAGYRLLIGDQRKGLPPASESAKHVFCDGTKFLFMSDAASVADAWREICDDDGIDPYDREVFEHWAVDSWLAEKLEAKGEKVDRDFAVI